MDTEGNAYGPYDTAVTGSQSEAFDETTWARLFQHLSGVNSGGALTFTGLTATVSAIDGLAHGFFLSRASSWSYTSPATTGAQPRRDLLVLRRQLTSGAGVGAVPGKTYLAVIQGTPAATPVDPTHDPVNEERLWSWQVPASGGTVVTSIRDFRRRVAGDRTIGEAHLSGAVGLTLAASPSWTDVAVVTAVSSGRECVARWAGTFHNADSGQNRTGSWRVMCDATQLGSTVGPISLPLATNSANQPRISRRGGPSSIPAAGLHTWKLQANGSFANSVVAEVGSLIVVEK